MTSDIELLEQHRTSGSDAAFATIVRRHVGWIHGVAARRLRDSHIADDVAQAVFILLHRKSPHFQSDRSLVAWLHRAAWYATEVAARKERRRQRHETEAAMMRQQQQTSASADPQWLELAPMLDGLIERLSQADREAVLLRYYRQMSYADVAAATGATEEAARKRVDRAIEKLRRMAGGNGVIVSVATLGVVLETQVATAAPAGLVATTTAAALAESGALVAALANPIAGGISTLLTLGPGQSRRCDHRGRRDRVGRRLRRSRHRRAYASGDQADQCRARYHSCCFDNGAAGDRLPEARALRRRAVEERSSNRPDR